MAGWRRSEEWRDSGVGERSQPSVCRVDTIIVHTTEHITTKLLGGTYSDVIYVGARTVGEADGGSHHDTLIATTRVHAATTPMILRGGRGSDTLIASYLGSDNQTKPPIVELYGDEDANNELCASIGLTKMVGSEPAASTPSLYVSGSWARPNVSVPTDMHAETAFGATAGGYAGATVHNARDPDWPGPILADLLGPPEACLGWVEP